MSSLGVEMLNILPEDCLSNILSPTSPADACQVSTVSTTLRSAADSDGIWVTFLLPDYKDIIAQSDGSFPPLASFASLKQLYFRFCNTPVLINEGKKSFSLDKWTGKKCFMIAARDLIIIWSNTPHYWTWISLPESRFAEVAELLEVYWLEIRGKINISMLPLGTNYAAYMVFKFTAKASGFERYPVKVSIDTFGVESSIRTLYLYLYPREGDDQPPMQRKDGWLEIEFGEYFNKGGQDQELEMHLLGVDSLHWKRGLIIQGIEIRPKEINIK